MSQAPGHRKWNGLMAKNPPTHEQKKMAKQNGDRIELRRALTGSSLSRPALRRLLQPDLDRAAWKLAESLDGDPTPMRAA